MSIPSAADPGANGPATGPAAAELGPPPHMDPTSSAFFLDFDGTLAPLVARPDMARMAPATVEAVERLRRAADFAVAIVTGRTLESADAQLAPLRMTVAGSHGIEIRHADGRTTWADGVGADGVGAAGAIAEIAAFGEARGLMVEIKPAGAAVHYRNRPELAAECRAEVEAAAARLDGARVVHGNMIAEFSLALATKGTAVEAYMAAAPFQGRRPIFAGDDVTDEDGFRAVRQMGGLAIKVGPGPTTANARVADIGEFLNWLERLTRG